ncbi:hybrid sensor histidine kinase/response regulator [Allocoleopsis franciscana]|uniref:histidine kinase n=1 Tax=Allocoleopsis franciscana PCC 7113 TaxID=1173027 RepID=K9WII7_9CYAN|nr:ATP-binding protein [Allocoleopsis franciscana]AFZ20225.1 PAS domain S-box [Allocoleopsis franciscana PCC 7113]
MSAKILVVDDESAMESLIRQKFRRQIRDKNLDFIFAYNGREALEKLQSDQSVDVVLVDINMPEMDGLTFIERLKDLEPNIKAVVVSAYDDVTNIRSAMNRGAFDFITKPIDFNDLEITINKSLEHVREIKEKQQKLQQAQNQLLQSNQALRESEQRFRQLAENIKEVFWVTSVDRTQVIYVSPGYELVWHSSSKQLYEQPMSWVDAVHPEDRERVCTTIETRQGEEYEQEYRIMGPDRSIYWIRDRAFPVKNEMGQVYRLVGLSEDITVRKLAEEEICKALQRERELSELKTSFVAMTSHEFRTPLTTIQSSVELLEHYSHNLSEEKQQIHLHRISRSVERMVEMLNDILLISESEAGQLKFNPTPIDLVKFCQRVVEELGHNDQRQPARSNPISVCHRKSSIPDASLTANLPVHHLNANEGAPSEQVQTLEHASAFFLGVGRIAFKLRGALPTHDGLALMDAKLLLQILTNLLLNALKYSAADSTVQFDLIYLDHKAVFRIQDQGIGIPTADQCHLFESFFRASNIGTIQGTGLGLAIVKQCVDLHQGEITVDSVEGMGTTFTVTLPLEWYTSTH